MIAVSLHYLCQEVVLVLVEHCQAREPKVNCYLVSVSVPTAHGGGYLRCPGPFIRDWIYPKCLILGLVQRMLPPKMRDWREGPTSLSALRGHTAMVPFLVLGTSLVTNYSLFCFFCYLIDLVRFSQAGFWADFSSLPLGPRGLPQGGQGAG